MIDFLAHLCTRENDLAADEDEKHNLWLHHTVDQTREQLRLIGAKVMMLGGETFETDGELDVTRADDVLDLEVGEFSIEAKLLDNTRVFARRKLGIIFGLCSSYNHLAGGEDQGGRFRFTDTHDDGCETL